MAKGMKHFINLERCDQCGAYRYLCVKKTRRGYSVYLRHYPKEGSEGTRADRVLAHILNSELDFHRRENKTCRDNALKGILEAWILSHIPDLESSLEKRLKESVLFIHDG